MVIKNMNGWTYMFDENKEPYTIKRISKTFGRKFIVQNKRTKEEIKDWLEKKLEELKEEPIVVDDVLEYEFYKRCYDRLR